MSWSARLAWGPGEWEEEHAEADTAPEGRSSRTLHQGTWRNNQHQPLLQTSSP